MSLPCVLYLIHQFGNQTGVELHTQMLAQGLSKRYEVAIAWPTSDGIYLHDKTNGTRIFPGESAGWPKAPYRQDRTADSVSEIVRLVRPDIIHIQHFLNWLLGIIDQARDSAASLVVSFHDHFALSPNYALTGTESPGETLTPAYAKKTFGRDFSPWLRQRREILQRSLKSADALVTVSPYVEQQLSAAFPGHSFRQIEYGIVGFDPLPKSQATGGLRFGFLGQLVPMKGWKSLVRGFAAVRCRHPTVELHLFGGECAESWPGACFHGPYGSGDLARICSELDVGVVPSTFAETYCMVLSEMWRGGLPVAASNIGALQNRVRDNVNGMKFEPGDPASIAETLCWFAEHDEWRQWQLPQPRLVSEMVADYDRLYQELLGRERVHSSRLTGQIGNEENRGSSGSPGAPAVSPAQSQDLSFATDRRVEELLIVQSCGFLDEGDGVYRLHGPSRALSRLDYVTVVDCHPHHRCSPQLMAQADVLILSSYDEDIFPLLERRRAAGRVTVLEANDYYFDPHPWNSAATSWINRSLDDWFSHLLRLVDGIQASTPELARRWRERTNRPIGVFPNQLAETRPLPPAPSRHITIGWGGSLGHLADWYQLAPRLQQWLDANPEIHLAVMTNDNARPFLQLSPERYHFHTFGTLDEYLDFLDGIDIGLAPLLPTEFNRCRSDVKFVEYASRGVVGIYADLEPYHDSVKHGRTGFLYRSPDELFTSLNLLVADAALRGRIRQDAYAYVVRDRRLENHIGERVTFYRQLLAAVRDSQTAALSPDDNVESRTTTNKPQSFSLSDAVASHLAVRDGRYFQFRPREPERLLGAAIDGPSTRESAAALETLVQQHPHYSAAIQQLGTTLNDLHDSARARPFLERARQLNPQAVEPLCQLARLYHRMGDLSQARQLLETAIDINPYSPRPWRYLLRLLPAINSANREARASAVDGRPWAARARQLHPANYALALSGAHLYPVDESIPLLRQLVDSYAPQLRPDDVTAIALFSVTIGTILGPCLDRSDALLLVRHAATIFPQSTRLSDLLARTLLMQGHIAAAHAEFARGQQLRRIAMCYRAEFPKEDSMVPIRQIAEHLLLFEDG